MPHTWFLKKVLFQSKADISKISVSKSLLLANQLFLLLQTTLWHLFWKNKTSTKHFIRNTFNNILSSFSSIGGNFIIYEYSTYLHWRFLFCLHKLYFYGVESFRLHRTNIFPRHRLEKYSSIYSSSTYIRDSNCLRPI